VAQASSDREATEVPRHECIQRSLTSLRRNEMRDRCPVALFSRLNKTSTERRGATESTEKHFFRPIP
jgi:hypothetical protein